jgi:hypothetical protein
MSSVLICLPTYGRVEGETAVALARLCARGRDAIAGVAHVSFPYTNRARNDLARQALASPGVTDTLWLDADMVWPEDLVERLLARSQLGVVGGLTFRRQPPFHPVAGRYAARDSLDVRPLEALPPALARVDYLGLGATLVPAAVLAQMRDRFGDERWFRSEESGEDVWFFDRCRRLGVPVWLDPSLDCGHIASHLVTRRTWEGARRRPSDPDGPDGYPFDAADLYAEVVKRLPTNRPSVAVEVGCYLGRSIIVLAGLVRRSGKPVSVFAVDHFRGSADPVETGDSAARHRAAAARGGGTFRGEFEDNLRRAGLRDLVEVVQDDSAAAAALFAPGSVDFVFLDASHDERSVRADIAAWLPRVRPGGVLAGHDFSWPGVRAAVADLLPGAVAKSRDSWWYERP